MKKFVLILLALLSLCGSFYSYIEISSNIAKVLEFIFGTLFGVFLMNIIVFSKNKKINSYARELEKESIASSENSSRVKVLEAKIEVLEKALENALKK